MATKMKITVTSDGTIEGTKVKLNGEDMTETKNVTHVHFSAHGGVAFRDGDSNLGSVTFSISTLEKDEDGVEISEEKSFTSSGDSFVVKRMPIGKKMNDFLVGKSSPILDEIDTYRDKGRFIPTRDELKARSWDSVVDLCDDLKKENG